MINHESPTEFRRKTRRHAKTRRPTRRRAATRREVTLNLTVLTPAFVTSTGHDSAAVTVPTMRDLLRWWYRALVGHEAMRGLVDSEADESRLFGNAKRGTRPGLRIRITPSVAFDILPAGSPMPRSGLLVKTTPMLDGIWYMAGGPTGPLACTAVDEGDFARGAGLSGPGNVGPRRGPVLRKPAIAPDSRFSVHLSWSEGALDDRQVEDVVRAAASLVALGGIGARCRKGFGALDGDIEAPAMPEAREWWDAQIDGILHGPTLSCSGDLPPFPCLAYGVVRLDPVVSSTWQHALGRLGQFYEKIRPRGPAGWIAGSMRPKMDSSLLLTVSRANNGFRGVGAVLPHVRPDGHGAEALRDYLVQFREAAWPDGC